jgi:ATP-binding cassette subfamily F protein 3
MISLTDIFIKYGDRILLDHISLSIMQGDKIGLTGRNGAGKSTLLKVIAGENTPDRGKVNIGGQGTLGFLHQEMYLPKGKTVMEETLTAFDKVKKLQKEIEGLHDAIANRTDYESKAYHDLLDRYAEFQERFHHLGGDSMEADTQKVLFGLGFKQRDFERLTDEFSGGWQMRIELAKMLLKRPDYLLLDEPTNHLDIESIIWLEQFLSNYPGAVIIISHDKQFLDNITTRTIEIELGKAFDYKASYSKFVQLRKERQEKQQAAYLNQQRVIAQKERTINRFMAKANKTKMAQSMQKQLEKIDRIEVDTFDTAGMSLKFPPAARSGEVVLEGKKVTKHYGNLEVLNDVDFKILRGERVAFVGQNGQGKTTLAKILINEISASSGEVKIGHNVEVGYYAQDQSDTLHQTSTVLETMEQNSPAEMRTKLRSILGAFMFSGEDVDKKISVLSGGERARLAMACMLLKPFNLLVLDEPTNHLDIISKDILKKALMEYDGTLIVVSHDREFLGGLTDKTVEFRDQQLFTHLGDVNYFLEKRSMDNMREVEMSSSSGKTKENVDPAKVVKQISYEERKKLMRTISNAEKKIENLEEEISNFEKLMEDPSFYSTPDSEEKIKTYQQKKSELETVMEKWEEASIALDEAGE